MLKHPVMTEEQAQTLAREMANKLGDGWEAKIFFALGEYVAMARYSCTEQIVEVMQVRSIIKKDEDIYYTTDVWYASVGDRRRDAGLGARDFISTSDISPIVALRKVAKELSLKRAYLSKLEDAVHSAIFSYEYDEWTK